MKILLRSLAAIVIVGLLLWYLPKLDFDAIKGALAAADLKWVFFGAGTVVLVWCLRSFLLYQLIRQKLSVTYRTVLGVNFIGAMFDILIPGRSGALARWGLLSLRFKNSKGFLLSSLMVFVILEAAALMLLFLIAFVSNPDLQEFSSPVMNIVLFGIILGLLISIFFSAYLEKWIKRFSWSKWTPIQSFFELMHRARKPRTLLWWISLGLLNWVIQSAALNFYATAFGFELGFAQEVLLIMAVNLAIVVPIVPGHIGTMQLVVTTVLTQMGIPSEKAFVFSIVYHLAQVLPVLAIGGLLTPFFPVKGLKASLKSDGQVG